MNLNRRKFIVGAAALTSWPVATAFADRKRKRKRRDDDDDDDDHDDHDYEDALKARESGDALPLRDILDELNKTHKGNIVGIEFEKEDEIWVYEIKMVTAEGRFLEIYVNARTNRIIKIKGN